MKPGHSRAYLYPTVTPVCNNNIPIAIYSHTSGCVELAVPFTMWAKFKQELAISIVNLQEAINPKQSKLRHVEQFTQWKRRAYRTLTEWLWKSVTTISFLLFMATKWGPYGHRRRKTERERETVIFSTCCFVSKEISSNTENTWFMQPLPKYQQNKNLSCG